MARATIVFGLLLLATLFTACNQQVVAPTATPGPIASPVPSATPELAQTFAPAAQPTSAPAATPTGTSSLARALGGAATATPNPDTTGTFFVTADPAVLLPRMNEAMKGVASVSIDGQLDVKTSSNTADSIISILVTAAGKPGGDGWTKFQMKITTSGMSTTVSFETRTIKDVRYSQDPVTKQWTVEPKPESENDVIADIMHGRLRLENPTAASDSIGGETVVRISGGYPADPATARVVIWISETDFLPRQLQTEGYAPASDFEGMVSQEVKEVFQRAVYRFGKYGEPVSVAALPVAATAVPVASQTGLLGTWQCQVQADGQTGPAVLVFESASRLRVNDAEFGYETAAGGISIDGDLYELVQGGDNLVMSYPDDSVRFDCERSTDAGSGTTSSSTAGTSPSSLLGTWQCQIRQGDDADRAVYVFESESSVLIDDMPFSYALLPDGINIGGATFALDIAGDILSMSHPDGFHVECEKGSDLNVARQQTSEAVELEPDRTYSEGTLVVVAQLGVSFQIPQGWSGGLMPGRDVVALSSETRRGSVFAMGQQSASAEEVAVAMSQSIPLSQTALLTPVTPPQVDGQWVLAVYTGSDGTNALAGFGAAMMDPNGKGILYLVYGPVDEAQYYIDLMDELIGSTKSNQVTSTATPKPTGPLSPLEQQWTDWLAGNRMKYIHTFTSDGGGTAGSSAERDLFLCSDGRFVYQEESSVSVDVEGAGGFDAGTDSDTGRWRIVTQGSMAGVELTWDSGGVSTHALDYVDGKTYLDGERWYVTGDNPYCY